MSRRICGRFGTVAGASTGLIVNLLGSPACCGATPLALHLQMIYGIAAALAAVLPAVAFACLVSRRPSRLFLVLGVLIAIVDGWLLGPVAYALPHPMVAMFVCAVLGALLAILLCWLLCLRRDFAGVGR